MITCIVGTQRSQYTATQIVAIGKTFDIVPFMNYVAYVWLLSEFTDKRWYPVGSVWLQWIECCWLVLRSSESFVTVSPKPGPREFKKCSRKAAGRWKYQGSKFNAGPHATTSTWVLVFLERSKIKHVLLCNWCGFGIWKSRIIKFSFKNLLKYSGIKIPFLFVKESWDIEKLRNRIPRKIMKFQH